MNTLDNGTGQWAAEALSNYNAIKAAHDDLIAAMRSAVAVLERSEAEARSKNLPYGVGDAIVYLVSALVKAGYAVRN